MKGIGPLVYVVWYDSHINDNKWETIEEVGEVVNRELLCYSVGWLLPEKCSDMFLLMAPNLSFQGPGALNCISIPKGCILSIKELKEKEVINESESEAEGTN